MSSFWDCYDAAMNYFRLLPLLLLLAGCATQPIQSARFSSGTQFAVTGDHLKEISDLYNVQGVMLNGRYRTLDELLD